jgi:hypothetical protein
VITDSSSTNCFCSCLWHQITAQRKLGGALVLNHQLKPSADQFGSYSTARSKDFACWFDSWISTPGNTSGRHARIEVPLYSLFVEYWFDPYISSIFHGHSLKQEWWQFREVEHGDDSNHLAHNYSGPSSFETIWVAPRKDVLINFGPRTGLIIENAFFLAFGSGRNRRTDYPFGSDSYWWQ